jgi:hypothetical protein
VVIEPIELRIMHKVILLVAHCPKQFLHANNIEVIDVFLHEEAQSLVVEELGIGYRVRNHHQIESKQFDIFPVEYNVILLT